MLKIRPPRAWILRQKHRIMQACQASIAISRGQRWNLINRPRPPNGFTGCNATTNAYNYALSQAPAGG